MPECPILALVGASTDVLEYEGQRNRADPAKRLAEIILVRRDLFDCLRTATMVVRVALCVPGSNDAAERAYFAGEDRGQQHRGVRG